MYSSLSPSFPIESCEASNQVDNKNKKMKIKKKRDKQEIKSQPNPPHIAESIDLPTKTPHNPKFPCRICKGDHLLKDCHGLFEVLELWYEAS